MLTRYKNEQKTKKDKKTKMEMTTSELTVGYFRRPIIHATDMTYDPRRTVQVRFIQIFFLSPFNKNKFASFIVPKNVLRETMTKHRVHECEL